MKPLTILMFLFLATACGGKVSPDSEERPVPPNVVPSPSSGAVRIEVLYGECARLTGYYDMREPLTMGKPSYKVTLAKGIDSFDIWPWYKDSYRLTKSKCQ